MKDYRLYLFGPRDDGGPMASAMPLDGRDDPEAILVAERRRQGRYAELWRKGSLVKVFEPDRRR